MASSGMRRRAAIVRTDVLEERRQLIVTVNVPSSIISSTLTMEAIRYSETSILTRATRHHIPDYGPLHSHRRENFKF
jgi:hypothetical protein